MIVSQCTAQKNIKFASAQQAKQIYKYKNIKEKL